MNYKLAIMLLAAFLAMTMYDVKGVSAQDPPASDGGETDSGETGGDSSSGTDGGSSSESGDSSFTADVEASTKNLLGLSCLVDAVLNLEDSVGDFQYDIQVCGVELPMDVSFVMDDVGDLANIADKIVDDNDAICDNAAYKEDVDADKATSDLCAATIQRQMTKLQTAITTATTDIAAVTSKNSCIAIAISDVELILGNLSKKISTCSKLAGNA